MSGYDFSLLKDCTKKAMLEEADKYSDKADAIVHTPDWEDMTKREGLKQLQNQYWRIAAAIRLYARTGKTSVRLNGTLSKMRLLLEEDNSSCDQVKAL